ncbi:MAG: RNA methyltransferase [Acidobacteria bacterium]|nr:RNA methyltransferase [Acidobacteriota bacterium]
MMPGVHRLTSKNNPLLKRIRLLASASRRAPEEVVLAEGTRVLEEAVRSGYSFEAVVSTVEFGSNSREAALLRSLKSRRVPFYQVGQGIFRSVSCLKSPQGAIALVKAPRAALPPQKDPDALVLYACGIQDPGNLGTLIRTAAAAGASLFCTSKETVSAGNPKAIRSSAGAFFHLKPVEHVDFPDFLDYCVNHSIRLYRTDAREGVPHTESDLKSPCAILLGNEGSGMNKNDYPGLPAIRIPLAAGIDSLNVALAGAVILFEASRQRSAFSRTAHD